MKTIIVSASLLFAFAATAAAELSADKYTCLEEAKCNSGPALCYSECFGMTEAQYNEVDACFNECTTDQVCAAKCGAQASEILGADLSDVQKALSEIYAADIDAAQSSATASSTESTSASESASASTTESESVSDSVSASASTTSAASSAASSVHSTASASRSASSSSSRPSSGDSDEPEEDESSSASTIGAFTGSVALAAVAVARFNF
ncbi:hypothetical protein H4R33_005835 [Dimargaris cristalligena]|uniref:Extracellular membrane protein CFEM domain-containing protein n=1 Tax=Dimargaris cristalligena TaxID=215637 RepID=A0A4P9ZUG8_9FUNG|nr:hypothetical protein H4R33_005835 [Dimargaris cristalligena]RKP37246.1 hypothetical protein BJ085DRAFT_40638 [Dimargaris cristalligena]|eukprot:RKP37246.1 hypothetical protein BJ085DRAFT_40638 [Dimargaris cristalligena]